MPAASALAEANARLLRLRAERQPESALRLETPPVSGQAAPPWQDRDASTVQQILKLPAHLGWGSETATKAVRQAQARQAKKQQLTEPLILLKATQSVGCPRIPSSYTSPGKQQSSCRTTITVLPDLAFGIIKKGLASQGRLWYLLRHLDEAGRGWHLQGAIRRQLTKTELRFCGRRQLANLLKEGNGIFWRFGRGRIWLFSAGRVAANLGVTHATYRPVAVPLKAFLDKVGQVRAHFYVTYHSARAKDNELGMPVARETIEQITGVDPHSQRSYEKLLHLDVRQNIAVGEEIIANEQGQALAQERAWRHGNALFTLIDYKGKQGAKGRRYHAWQLPNSYGAIHAAESRGGRRRLNRQLIDLQKKGAGNDRVGRRYFANGKLLERAQGLLHRDRYCPTGRFGAGGSWSVWSEGVK